ncbi:alpha-D-ribose 1-methylphosphonate 5-triphosphate diphosphatase [Salidesulfovibrio brasiliensis]|uniref:alpha-D-ribose 1-methylphosphonate 5-triphosphate diphosphatase n=1 Tax=Salidesulfovibrio brasiliensis TaxID=221711 RepID=UPI0006D1B580|nr:alpha-D-ribose 1-methylphosphonate 5-triphosphate diphosphatase [Salidesulfovibrio brasiliensis]
MPETIFTNARIVTETEIIHGSLTVYDGRIRRIDEGTSSLPGGTDCDGDYLIPGLVDVHTDSLERQFTPRPGVYWPSPLSAATANDTLLCGCGITTVLDSICAEAFPEEETRRRMFNDCIAAVTEGERRGLFRSNHLLHLRCETADPKTPGILNHHLDNPLVKLASLMDHTPGQRQYRDENKFREYYSNEGWTDEEFAKVVSRLKKEQAKHAEEQRAAIIAQCRKRGIPMASHDDASEPHVRQALEEGIGICEFPTTYEAASTAHAAGMDVVMGAPNVVLGGSHSGNVSALEVFRAGLLTVLTSDYVPGSLLLAPFRLHHEEGRPLPECIALVTANPARMLGLEDRGRIAENLHADLVRVRLVEGQPVAASVHVSGRAVLSVK